MPCIAIKRALRHVLLILAALAAILVLIPAATALALTVDADLTADARWTVTDSPVTVTSNDWTIPAGLTLTVDPGVTVRLAGKITAYGAIVAGDATAEPVVFEAADPASGWDGIAFTRATCSDPHSFNVLHNARLKDLAVGLTVDRQSLSLEDSEIYIVTESGSALHAINDNATLCPGPWAELHLIGNSIAFTSADSAPSSLPAVKIDGMTSHVADNAMVLTFTGSARGVTAIQADTAGAAPFAAQIHGNVIDAEAANEFTDFLFGIRYANRAVVGTVAGNTLRLTAKNEIRAIVTYDNAVIGNDVTAISHSDFNFSPEIDLIGIESRSNDPSLPIADNRVELTTPDKRYEIGIFCQSGSVSNNRIIASLSGSAGYAIGILQQYGTATLANNSIYLSGSPSVSLYGVFLAGSSMTDSVTITGNIVAADGSMDSQGIFAAPSYGGIIENSYNLIYNFIKPYNGVSAGAGDVYDDPLFTDLKTLELSADSPALTGTTAMGADPTVQTAELPPEPAPPPPPAPPPDSTSEPEPLPAPEPEPTSEPAPEPDPVSEPVPVEDPVPTPEPAPAPIPPAAPVITTNDGHDFATEADAMTLTGFADPASVSVWVNNAQDGVTYAAGSTSWSYAGSLVPGVNTFTVFSKDAAGLVSGTATIQITRADLTPPAVLSVSPAENAQGVSVSGVINVEFSEEMDPSTVTASSFFVNGVAGDVLYSGTSAEFRPAANWQYETSYAVTITTAMKDKAGNALNGAMSWIFRTEPKPCVDFRKGHHYGDDRCKEKEWKKEKKEKKEKDAKPEYRRENREKTGHEVNAKGKGNYSALP